MKNAQFPHLHHNAPQVPEGLTPKPGVTYGCGDPDRCACYQPLHTCPNCGSHASPQQAADAIRCRDCGEYLGELGEADLLGTA